MDIIAIERLRKIKKLTQKQFAESLGITDAGYIRMLKVGDLKVSTLEKLCDVFNVNIFTFFGSETNLNIVSEPREKYGNPLKNTKNEEESCTSLRQTISILNEQLKNNQATISALNNTVNILNSRLEDALHTDKAKRAATTR